MKLCQGSEYRRYCEADLFRQGSNDPKTAAREDVLLLCSAGALLSLYNYYIMLLHRCTVPRAHRKRKNMTQTRKTDSRIHIKSLEKYRKKTPVYNIIYIYVHFHIWQTCRKTRVQVKCLTGKNPYDWLTALFMVAVSLFVFCKSTYDTVPASHMLLEFLLWILIFPFPLI